MQTKKSQRNPTLFEGLNTLNPEPRTLNPVFECTTRFESELWKTGYQLIAGVDEVGRGAWAGPVVAAAVILHPERIPAGLNDSKQLSAATREVLAGRIWETALAVAVAEQDAPTVDRVNILEATRLAMRAALGALTPQPDFVLLDALELKGLNLPQQGIVKGDSQSVSIAAASIVAKVYRDRLMTDLDSAHPAYGFARHKGYGTPQHRRALAENGPCVLHRLTFRGVLPAPDLGFKF